MSDLPALILQSLPQAPAQAQQGGVIALEQMPPERQAMARDLAATLDFADPNAVLTWGVGPQEDYKETMLALMRDIKVGDTGLSGDLAVALAKGLDILNVERLYKEVAVPGSLPFILSRLPVFGRAFSVAYGFAQRQRDFEVLIREIERQAKTDQRMIIEHNLRLEAHFQAASRNYEDLALAITAGMLALERGQADYEHQRAAALASGDSLAIARVQQLYERLAAFDTRLLRLKSAYVKAPLTGQKILAAMQAGRIEIQNILDSLLFDMTNLIEAASQVAALHATDAAQQRRARRAEVAARIEAIGGELLDKTLTTAKASQGAGIEEVKRLKAQADQFIALTRKVNEIDAANQRLRAEAETMLVAIQQDFSTALGEIGRSPAG